MTDHRNRAMRNRSCDEGRRDSQPRRHRVSTPREPTQADEMMEMLRAVLRTHPAPSSTEGSRHRRPGGVNRTPDGAPIDNRYHSMYLHQEPPNFAGESECWEDFFLKFDAVTDWNGWNNRERADSL